MKTSIKEKLKGHFHEVLRTKTSSHAIGVGFSIGTFISILPTPGLNIILATLIVLIFKKVSKISLFASILFWNPLTVIPISFLSLKIGNLIFGSANIVRYNIVFLDAVYNFSRRYLVGNLILAFSLSIISYIIVKSGVDYYKSKTHKK